MKYDQQTVPPEKRLLVGWLKGTKRTCPKCGKIFITRQNKRIHQKDAHKKYL